MSFGHYSIFVRMQHRGWAVGSWFLRLLSLFPRAQVRLSFFCVMTGVDERAVSGFVHDMDLPKVGRKHGSNRGLLTDLVRCSTYA